MRHLLVPAVLLIVLSGCKEKVADSGADAGAAKSVHAASPVDDTPTHDRGGVAPTDKPSQDGAADAGAATGEAPAEVEIMGAITGAPSGTRTVVAVSRTECKANDETVDLYGQQTVQSLASFFIEVFVPQGSQGYLCVYALRDTEVVAFGTGDKNPMVMKGHGEVLFANTKVELKPVSKWKAPKQLLPH